MSLFEYDEKKHERTMLEIGREEGREDGDIRRLLSLIRKKVQKGKSIDQIADELEEAVEIIQPLYEIVLRYAPDYNISDILDEVMTSKAEKYNICK